MALHLARTNVSQISDGGPTFVRPGSLPTLLAGMTHVAQPHHCWLLDRYLGKRRVDEWRPTAAFVVHTVPGRMWLCAQYDLSAPLSCICSLARLGIGQQKCKQISYQSCKIFQ